MPARIVATVDLGIGDYVLYGNVVFHNTHATAHDMVCGLGDPGLVSGGQQLSQVDFEMIDIPGNSTASVSLEGVIQIDPGSPPRTTVSCAQGETIDAGTIDWEDADIGAIQVEQLG